MSQRCTSGQCAPGRSGPLRAGPGRSGPSRLVRSVCATALAGAVALALPAAPVHAVPEPDPAATGALELPDGPDGPGGPDGPDGPGGPDAPDGLAGPDAPEATGSTETGSDTGTDTGTGTASGEDPSLRRLLTRLQDLYRRTEQATEAYNATEEELKAQRKETQDLNVRLARARTRLADGQADAGRLARQQYQGGGAAGLSTYLRMLLSADPQEVLEEGHLFKEAAGNQAATVARLTGNEKRADQLAKASRAALDEQQVLTERRRKQRDAVEGRLKEVEELLSTLSEDQLAELGRMEQQGTDEAQRGLVSSGELNGSRAPSASGDRAVRYGLRQIGKPYVWGAQGPGSFDCSGLTSQAWSHAGRPVPRTSQEQWRRLPHVPLRALRPGDLVIYFPGATHVAMYLGDGMVVQAPRPGARVKVSPVASNPLLGAVRPDQGAPPLRAYVPPPLPDDATAGADTGYGSAAGPA
ncbi:C40 family peptidase [Streptomyces chrestomyceticus]|uniref:C40 family peptidase n=1 Tax=Streptomyces chrestomyceticus TaxID=68185 RepID=UPI0035A8EC06